MVKIANWKLVTGSELGEYKGGSVNVYDPHYDNTFRCDTFIIRVNGSDYLCATDATRSGIYPVVDKENKLELLNSFTVGKFDGREARVVESFFTTEEQPQLL